MLLGLTILLVLLAWTLGNTIARSTSLSTLDANTSRSPYRISVLRIVGCLHARLTTDLSWAFELLRRIGLQTVLVTSSPQGDVVAATVATTGPLSVCCALLIGRTSVGSNRYPSITARDSYQSACRLLIRARGKCG